MSGQTYILGLQAMRLGCPGQEKSLNFAAWTAPVRLPVLMERTHTFEKKRACRLPHAAAETGLMASH